MHTVANAPEYEQSGSDVYVVAKGDQTGPWTVRNLLLEPRTSSEQGIGARTLLVEVDDVPGVLNEVTGVIARRGYNIQSLAVGNSEQPGRSRITIVLPGQSGSINKLMKQLMKLIVVQDVVEVTDVPHVSRELILVKVRVLLLRGWRQRWLGYCMHAEHMRLCATCMPGTPICRRRGRCMLCAACKHGTVAKVRVTPSMTRWPPRRCSQS